MTTTRSEVSAGTLALYDKLIATNPEVERKGAKMPYTSLNGHMFSFITTHGTLALRLPAGAREAFVDAYGTNLCVQYGKVMKEYVEVPDTLLKQTRKLKTYFDQSYAYVASLAPKPTTRSKKAVTKKKVAVKKVAVKKKVSAKKKVTVKK